MSAYPENWPRCPICGDFAMDGHITCGKFECNEGDARRERDAINESLHGFDDRALGYLSR